VFSDQPDAWHLAWQVADAAGLKRGTIFPRLARLEQLGWITSRSEDADVAASEGRRYPRRHWRLADEADEPQAAVARWRRDRAAGQQQPWWSPQPGEAYVSS
jgi:PadR family transcriptional regulator PadR